MVQLLFWLTTLVNLAGLAASLCLGLYLITRTPRSRLSWLAALLLGIMACFFLHNALALNAPASRILPLLRPIVIFALPLGFHLTLLLPPGEIRQGSWFYQPALHLPEGLGQRLGSLALPLSRLVVPLAYVLALALALGGVFPLGLASHGAADQAVFLSERVPGPLYPLSIAYLVLLGLLVLVHLGLGRHQTPSPGGKRRYAPLFVATLLTGLGGLYLGLGVWLQVDLPNLLGDAAVGTAAIILGYVVARHDAQVEGRDIGRELLYISLAIGLFTLFYVVVAEILYLGGHIFSTLTLILIIVVAVVSLMLYDGLRSALDRLFYRDQFRQLRANLRALTREAGIGQALPDRLHAILGALCRALQVRNGFVALKEGDAFVCQATERAVPPGQSFPLSSLMAAEATDLSVSGAAGLEDLSLLVPIYDGDDQVGALVLGPKEMDRPYTERDLLLLDDLADQLAAIVHALRLQDENARLINEMVADFRQREHDLQRQVQQMLAERQEESHPVLEGIDEREFVSLVEEALRRLPDFSYLGEHPLAGLQVVDRCLADRREEFVTHIDRGKALSEILVQAMDKLRPEGPEPRSRDVPSREWQQYIVLHDAYVLGELNRDIMARLYVSEGTFNRTRRRAVRSIAKALYEMEGEARHKQVSR